VNDSNPRGKARSLAFVLTIWIATSATESCFAHQAGTRIDPIRQTQNDYIASKDERLARLYHFGTQGPGEVFSNHRSHTNRMVPVYIFGTKARLQDVTGANSLYRDAAKLESLYGVLPPHTLNTEAEYADQSDLYRVQADAVKRGIKYLFILWFDGLDWETTRAAALIKTGIDYHEGKGAGLEFQDYAGAGAPQYGYVVTSPTHDDPAESQFEVNHQTVAELGAVLRGGYDARFAGPTPWQVGSNTSRGPGYLRGQAMTKDEYAAVLAADGVAHAYTDSASSAAEAVTGVKMYNGSINFRDDGTAVPTLFNQLQDNGWKVGTVTSVPFPHASPAAMYAHNVSRDDYQDLSREMLGLTAITQETGKVAPLPGLDVVIGCGWGINASDADLKRQGENVVPGNLYLTRADLQAIDDRHGGKYVVAHRTPGRSGAPVLDAAAERAAREEKRLFGFFGTKAGHLPYRTADGDFLPSKGIRGFAERYTPEDLRENPSLADMTRSALKVLGAREGQPFALFVEAGDVDFALHDNNLDNAAGAIFDGEAAMRVICQWVERNSNWDESLLIVTSDHGHYLVIDDPEGLGELSRRIRSAN
jgi:alkaline phosphatase